MITNRNLDLDNRVKKERNGNMWINFKKVFHLIFIFFLSFLISLKANLKFEAK